jgi:hypothetical protein
MLTSFLALSWLLCFEKLLLKLSASQPMREGIGVLER